MKKNWFLVFIALIGFQAVFAQFNFRQHTVVAGDDVYSIAKEYDTTPKGIYNLNPTAEQGIQPGTILVIPNVILAPEMPVEGVEFKKLKVKKKQTLYSISKKFNVSIDDIRKHNNFLTNEELRKGDILRIPLPAPKIKKVVRSLNKPTKEKKNLQTQIYTVKPKETKYGIARKFGITIPELENMNPNLGEDFPIGIQILVPLEVKKENSLENVNSKKLILYKVPSKQTMFSLAKEFEISSDSILKLNPELKDGLKSGMIIQVPNLNNGIESSNQITHLSDKLFDFETKNLAILLPFGIENYTDSDDQFYKNHLEKSKVTRLSVDFYAGISIALEKAKKLGLKTNVTVIDTKSDKSISDIVNTKNLKNANAIIGPLYSKKVDQLATLLETTNTPIFSPISNKIIKNRSNLYQCLPSEKTLQNKIINYVKKDSIQKNIIIIADAKHQEQKKLLQSKFPKANILDPEDKNFITVAKLDELIGDEEEETTVPNFVFLESDNLLLVSNVVSLLSGRAKTSKITLYTTSKSSVYDNEAISNSSLSNLNFHYPSANKITENTNLEFSNAFLKKYGVKPNSYAIRGYDLALDVLLRLSASSELSELNNIDTLTEYIENKFQYISTDNQGIMNTACYVIKYSENLLFKVVE